MAAGSVVFQKILRLLAIQDGAEKSEKIKYPKHPVHHKSTINNGNRIEIKWWFVCEYNSFFYSTL